MPRRSTRRPSPLALGLGLVAACSLVASAEPANADLIWDGDPALGTAVFARVGTGNCDGSASITAESDPMLGTVFRYHKPSGSNRCENHGFVVNGDEYIAQDGETLYLGWWSKLSTTANNNANFQWKSYGNHEQNYPLVMKMIGGQMTLMQVQPPRDETFIWRQDIEANEWNHYVLGIHVNRGILGGWVELWFNGEPQTFSDDSTRFFGRTLDTGDHNCPKWGIYGASSQEMTHWIGGPKIGTAYADVSMDGSGSGSGGSGSAGGGAGPAGGPSGGAGPGGTGGSAGTSAASGSTGLAGSGGTGDLPPSQAGVGGQFISTEGSKPPSATSGCSLTRPERRFHFHGWLFASLLALAATRRRRLAPDG